MKISDWFVVITILIATLAFFTQAERTVLLLKINKWQICLSAITLILYLPFLLFYDDFIAFIPILGRPPFSMSFKFLPTASGWAFIITLLTIFLIIWSLWRVKKVKPTTKLIDHYKECLNIMPFEDLFRLFVKYEAVQVQNSDNFKTYSNLLTDKTFFNSALNFNPNFFLGIVKNFDFQTILDSELPRIIMDKVNNILAEQKRLGVLSVYNYEPVDETEMPLFPLINCYFELMTKCIDANKFDSSRFGMLNFFPEMMFENILDSINIPEGLDIEKETPTYYHKLLSDFLSSFEDWIDHSKSEELANAIEHFMVLFCNCIIKLIIYRDSIISSYYLKIQFNSFLRLYFDENLNNVIDVKEEIEGEFLEAIPSDHQQKNYYKNRFKECWRYSDNVFFVGGASVFPHEKSKRDRFIDKVSPLLAP